MTPDEILDGIRYRASKWRAIWGDGPGVQGACDDIDALFVQYDSLLAENQQLKTDLETAVTLLHEYREQGAPGRVGRMLVDEFLAASAHQGET